MIIIYIQPVSENVPNGTTNVMNIRMSISCRRDPLSRKIERICFLSLHMLLAKTLKYNAPVGYRKL